jgi:hypothetical protein
MKHFVYIYFFYIEKNVHVFGASKVSVYKLDVFF